MVTDHTKSILNEAPLVRVLLRSSVSEAETSSRYRCSKLLCFKQMLYQTAKKQE